MNWLHLILVLLFMGGNFEPYQQTIVLADDRVLTYVVSDFQDFHPDAKGCEWKFDEGLTKYKDLPRYRNALGEVLEAVPAQGLCYQFKNAEEFNLYNNVVMALNRGSQVFPTAKVSKADFAYLNKKYKLTIIKELSQDPSEIYQVPDGRIVYVDSYWKEGRIYRTIDEYSMVRKLLGGGPVLMVPKIMTPPPSEPEGKN